MSGVFEEGRVERLKLSAREIVRALGLADLKERGGRLRGNAPWRSDSNSGGFSVDPETGGWNDFARDERGDVFDLVARVLNLADRAADRFPEVLAEAEALAGFRASGPGAAPSLAILERRRREAEAAAALEASKDDGRIKGPWRRFSAAEAEARFGFLAGALGAGDRSFFAEGYSIPELPEAPAGVAPFLYPSPIEEVDPDGSKESRQGFLYAARGERGALEAVKFKSRARTLAKGKRASRGVWGDKAALLGADLLPLAEGGTIVVCAGEEKALAGNACAGRLGLSVVFVASLFGEGFSAEHGPKQARRIVEAGPARVILAGDADAAGAKFNAAWRDGLFASDWPLERIGFLRWPGEAPKGFDVNDFLAAEGADALFARIENAPAMPAPEAPAPETIRGRAARARRKLSPAEAFTMPEPVRLPLAVIRRNLRERFEGLPEGGKLLAAAGTGTGKTFAAAGAVARELRRRTRRDDPLPRVLIASQKDLWPGLREALEGRGIAADRIAELPGRDCSTCRLHAKANKLRADGQNVARWLCGRGMKDPETGEAAEGGEAWTPCAQIVREEAAAAGHKAEPGCQGAKGQTGYSHLYETARRASVVLTTPERLFGLGFDRLEGDWPFGLLIVDEGVDRHLLPSRSIPSFADGIWRRRLDRLEGGKGAQEIPGLEGVSLRGWLDRLLEGVRPERAKLLERDATRRAGQGGRQGTSGPGARIAERDAWTAWAREAWPEEADPAERLAEEVGDLLAGLRGYSGLLPFEQATSYADAPPSGFRDYFEALRRDLEAPGAEPWLVCETTSDRDRGPVWRIVEPCSDNLAPLRDPARRVIVLDATPSSVARAVLGEFGFESFEAQAPDETRIVQVRGPVNGTGHLAEPKEPAEGFLLPAQRERFEQRRARWEEKRRAHEAGLVGILEGLGADPARAAVLTHKGRAFERLSVGATFGKHRGTNALAALPSLIVDGRSEPPSEETARERRLLSRTLANLGAPEPALHPLIARSRPDNRPGLQTRRRFVQYIGAEAEPRAVSVFSTGDDAVDSWTLERRERETLQGIGRLRGPDRAADEAEPGLVVIVTDDPLGLVRVDAFREWSEPTEAFESAAAELREGLKKDAAQRDAQRLEALERAVAELRLGRGTFSKRRISGQAGLPVRTMERTLERLGVSFAKLIGESCPEKCGTLGLYRDTADAPGGDAFPAEGKKERAPGPLAGPEPVELALEAPEEAAKEASGADPLPGALAEAAALGDQGAFESALAGARTPEQAPEGARAWAKDAAEALAVAASSPSLAGWLPALIRLSADPVRDGTEALRLAVAAGNLPAVSALLAEGASPTLPGRGGMGSALSLARWRSAPLAIDRALVAAALGELRAAPGPEPGALLRERLADPAGRASLAEWLGSEASRREGATRERPLAEALRAALAAMVAAEALAARPEAAPSAKAAKREAEGKPVRARDLRARAVIGNGRGSALALALDNAARLAAEALDLLAAMSAAAGPGNRTAEGSATA